MLLVCSPAGSGSSCSCLCCSLSFLVSVLLFLPSLCSQFCSLFVCHHCKILYILSLTGLYILLFLLPVLNSFSFFLFCFLNSVFIIFSLLFPSSFSFLSLLFSTLLFPFFIVYHFKQVKQKKHPPPPTGNYSAVSRPHFLLYFHIPCCFRKS